MNEEVEFLKVVCSIYDKQLLRSNRIGVDTKSIFGVHLRFNLEHTFPLLTTRKLSLRMIFEELMWFLRGVPDVQLLKEKKVHVWDGNSSREFLDKRGLKDYKIGEIEFIKKRIEHPHRKFFVDWVCHSEKIKSILEVGPGEMIEYQSISKRRPDIKYSISDISLLFINNCKEKYPKVDTYRIPLERLDSFEKGKFDCIYQASVLRKR